MELSKAKILANELIKYHQLTGWYFEYDNSVRRFGVCSHKKMKIGLSKNITLLNDESKVRDTILHEIAHALVGVNHGHDRTWKRKAIEIGCNGMRCYESEEVVTPPKKWIAICPKCKTEFHRHRGKNTPSSCGKCSNGKYNLDYKLVFNRI